MENEMKIVDMDENTLPLYLVCLEDWSREMPEAGNRKEKWYRRMKDRGLRVKLAVDDNGTVGGMIQYVPIEHSPAEGSGLYFVLCIWVHGHKQGRGDFRGHGMGRALLEAAEEDARNLGAKGMSAWGLLIPVFMRASWFRRRGYRSADRMGIQSLLWKPFAPDAVKPRWVRPKGTPPYDKGKVTVTAFCNGWCPAQNISVERAKRAAADPGFGGTVGYREVETFEKEDIVNYGFTDAIFINRRRVWTGPPPTYEKIRKTIRREAGKVR